MRQETKTVISMLYDQVDTSNTSKQCIACKNLLDCIVKIKLKNFKHIALSVKETHIIDANKSQFNCLTIQKFHQGDKNVYNLPDEQASEELTTYFEKEAEYTRLECRRISAEEEAEERRKKELRSLRFRNYNFSLYLRELRYSLRKCNDPGCAVKHIEEDSWNAVYDMIESSDKADRINAFMEEQEMFFNGNDEFI